MHPIVKKIKSVILRKVWRESMQYMKINNTYKFFAVNFLLILVLLCWMIYHNFPAFIHFEKRITQVFERLFGKPQMNYSDGIVNSGLTFLVTYGSAPYISIMTCFIAAFLFVKGDRALAVLLLGIVSTGGIFGIVLKKIFRRSRPTAHLSFDTGYSFPSGHAIASTLFFLAILLVFIPTVQSFAVRMILRVLIFLVWGGLLFSRLYFHAHHIGDLLAGISLGVFWVLTSMIIYNEFSDLLELLLNAFWK